MSNNIRKIRITRPTSRRIIPVKVEPLKVIPRKTSTRILIIEDQAAIREMLAESIHRLPQCEVIGSAADGMTGLELTLKLRPDVILLDVLLPSISGIELLRRLGKSIPGLKVLVFSAKQEPQIIRSLVQEGIHGFVNKDAPLSDLREALRSLASGGTWFSDDFSRTVREALAYPVRHSNLSIDTLTPREREIAVLIARSNSSKEVAQLLEISIKTAENHRANLMRKLSVRDVAGLVRLIIRLGLVDPNEE